MRKVWELSSARLCLASLTIVLIADALLLSRSTILLVPSSLEPVGYLLALLGLTAALFAPLSRFVDAQFGGQFQVFARTTRAVANFAVGIGFAISFNLAAAIATYLAVAQGWPLQDAAFARFEQAIGIDWTALLRWTNSHPLITHVMCWTYLSFIPQVALAVLILSFLRDQSALWEALALMSVGLGLSLAICGLLPALGPYAYYQFDPASYQPLDRLYPGVGRHYLPDLTAVYAGTYAEFRLPKMQGIITFPSYHVVVGLIMIYVARNVRYFAMLVAALNAVMIVATLPVGGHYFADILGGGLVFLASLQIVDWANRRRPSWTIQTCRRLQTRLPVREAKLMDTVVLQRPGS